MYRSTNMYSNLREEQKLVVNRIMCVIAWEINEKVFYLEAPGGCSNTFLYAIILNIVRGEGHIAIATLLLDGGTTLFGLPAVSYTHLDVYKRQG